MPRLLIFAISLFAFASGDIPPVHRLLPQPSKSVNFPADESLPVFPQLISPDQKPADQPRKAERLQPQSRLAIVRYVDKEFARAVKPLPAGKNGFHVQPGKPVDEKLLRQAIQLGGAGVNTGDLVQITRLEFRERTIVFEVNGGGKKRTRLRDRIQVGVSGAPMPTVSTTRTDPDNGVAPSAHGLGATVYLDFDKPLPDMSPDELKGLLSQVLDFSKQRSAAVQWTESLPPQFQDAIKGKRAAVGMDRDMVLAALGKPDRKVRERDADGIATEEWIYGQPPAKTVFVKFSGEHVTSVKEYP